MRIARAAAAVAAAVVLSLISFAAMAADPVRKEGTWIARDFKFHTGEVMPELRLAYTTVGEPTGEPVLVLHGTTGSAASMLGAELRRRAVRRGPAARCIQVFHHHSGRDRPRQIIQALRRPARQVPEVQL